MTEHRLIVAGVDTHKDTHYAAVISVTGEHLGAAQFPATDAGYRALEKASSPAMGTCCAPEWRARTRTARA